MARISMLLTLALVSGCIWVVDNPRVPPRDPAPELSAGDEDEVNYVIYREYYDCDPDEVVYLRQYRTYYDYDNCDLWFLLFLSRSLNLDIPIVVRRYEACGRRMHVLVRECGCEPGVFFVTVRDVDGCPPAYRRVYGFWARRQLNECEISNDEYRALVDLRIAVHYYGHTPEAFFSRCRGTERPCHVLYREYRDCGRGGKNCRERPCTRAEHPWELARSEREAWKRDVEAREEIVHRKFKEEHREQVERHDAEKSKVRHGDDEHAPTPDPRARPTRDEDERGRHDPAPKSGDEPRPKADPKDHGRPDEPPRKDPKPEPKDRGRSDDKPKDPPKPAPPPADKKPPPPSHSDDSDKGKDKDKDKEKESEDNPNPKKKK